MTTVQCDALFVQVWSNGTEQYIVCCVAISHGMGGVDRLAGDWGDWPHLAMGPSCRACCGYSRILGDLIVYSNFGKDPGDLEGLWNPRASRIFPVS